MNNLSLFKGLGTKEEINDPILEDKLKALKPPSGFRVFSERTQHGLHEIGIRRNDLSKQGLPIIGIPGYCFGNYVFINILRQIAKKPIEMRAISPYGEAQSDEWPRGTQMKDITLEHYLNPLRTYLEDLDSDFVLAGYSVGGLMAQLLTMEFRERVKGLVLIATVKAPNICKREYSVVERHGAVYSPSKDPNYTSDELMLDENNPDLEWIKARAEKSVGSNQLIDSYSNDQYSIDPEQFHCPVVEGIGTEDYGRTTGVYNPTEDLEVIEQRNMVGEIRIATADVLQLYGNCPQAIKVRIEGATHGSIMLGRHAEQTGMAIVENWKLFEAYQKASK